MGRDGLFPAIFAKTNDTSHTPAIATMFGAVLSILVTVFMDFVSVIEFLSFTCFFEFIIVVMACIILRYSSPERGQSGYERIGDNENQRVEESRSSCESSSSNHGVKDSIHSQSCSTSRDEEVSDPFQSHHLGHEPTNDRGNNIIEENPDSHKNYTTIPDIIKDNHSQSCRISNDEQTPLLSHHTGTMENLQNVKLSQRIKQKIEPFEEKINVMKQWANDNPTKVACGSLVTAIMSTFAVVFLLTYKMDEVSSGSGVLISTLLMCSILAVVECVPLLVLTQYPEDIPFKVMKFVYFE